MSKGLGLVGKGCVFAKCSPGTFETATGRSSIGHNGSPVTRLNAYTNACLVICTTAGTVLPSCFTSNSIGAVGLS
ncbi:hypothetical protein D3C83_193520 [compost metagenome]